jgi:hypothetical protein
MATGKRKPVASSDELATLAETATQAAGIEGAAPGESAGAVAPEGATEGAAPAGDGEGAEGAGTTPAGDDAAQDESAREGGAAAPVVPSQDEAPIAAPAVIEQPVALTFPRLVAIVNEMPIPRVVGPEYVEAYSEKVVMVGDEGEIARLKSDCEQIIALHGLHVAAAVAPLRVEEVE